ncbi:hypothetical protein LTR66_013933 [Elasticomyces elasticus]|nr:hypothetical protein LTR66_013933 [Elasticomyces elasticus]
MVRPRIDLLGQVPALPTARDPMLTTTSATRGVILQAWDVERITPRDRVTASSLAGGIAGGSIGLVTRGKSNALPGFVMFSIFGYAGQRIYNTLDAQHSQASTDANDPAQPADNVFKRFARQKWTPVSVLSDAEYEALLREKMLKVEVEIALIDDKIAQLREEEREKGKATSKVIDSVETAGNK